MIKHRKRDVIGSMGGPPGGICVGVAARAPVGPGGGRRWLTAGPMVGLGIGPAAPWPVVRAGGA